MTLANYALQYEECTLQELQTFVQNRCDHRTGPKALGHARCILILRRLDESQTFRFNDLPAELRNMVYDEALAYDREEYHLQLDAEPKSFANTALLRVSKRIYSEAKKHIYAASIFTIRAEWVHFYPNSTSDSGYLHLEGDAAGKFCAMCYPQEHLSSCLISTRTPLKYMKNVTLWIPKREYPWGRPKGCKLLFVSIVYIFGPKNPLLRLKVIVDDDPMDSPKSLKISRGEAQFPEIDLELAYDLLSPLSALPATTKLILVGFTKESQKWLQTMVLG